jgi:hypothetical protein
MLPKASIIVPRHNVQTKMPFFQINSDNLFFPPVFRPDFRWGYSMDKAWIEPG